MVGLAFNLGKKYKSQQTKCSCVASMWLFVVFACFWQHDKRMVLLVCGYVEGGLREYNRLP